ncbi:MAG: hypothetical protein WA697_00505 [Pseudolabrys sp.]
MIFAVLLGHVVSAEATEVLLKARDQATTNWAKVISKRFKATVEKLIPGLNAVILQVPAANVASFVKSAQNNPAISAVEAVSDYRQLFRLRRRPISTTLKFLKLKRKWYRGFENARPLHQFMSLKFDPRIYLLSFSEEPSRSRTGSPRKRA